MGESEEKGKVPESSQEYVKLSSGGRKTFKTAGRPEPGLRYTHRTLLKEYRRASEHGLVAHLLSAGADRAQAEHARSSRLA